MTSKTHHVIGLAAVTTILAMWSVKEISTASLIGLLITTVIGSMLPDMDQASNRLWDILPGGDFTAKVLKNIFGGHRNLSHSIVGVFLVEKVSHGLLFQLFNPGFINPGWLHLGLMTGYLAHLVADGITEEGLPLFYPIKWKIGFPPWKQMRMRTGHFLENWVVFPGVIAYLGWIVWANYGLFRTMFKF